MAELSKAKPWREHNPIVTESGAAGLLTAGSFQSIKCLKKKKPLIGKEGEKKKVEMGRKGKKHEKETKRNVLLLAFPPSLAGSRSAPSGPFVWLG